MKQILSMINFLCITLVIYFGVKVFYQTLSAAFETTQVQQPLDVNISPFGTVSIRPFTFYSPIIASNLFGIQKDMDPTLSQGPISDLKPTQLNLRLWGTAIGGKDDAYAVIENIQKNEQKLYRPGDIIQNATVKLILKDKVVLRVDDKNEVLNMQKMISATQPSVLRTPTRNNSNQSILLSRNQIDDAVQNINELMRQIKIRPHFLDGKPDGLAVAGIQPNSIFRKMGLQNGDIITGVNGKKIESVDDALTLYQNIKVNDTVTVQLKRRGNKEVISYQIK